VTSTRSEPVALTLPAITFAPIAFSTGADSPVIRDSLTSLVPLRTMPSAGTLVPGRTSTKSPSFRLETGTSSIRSPTIRCAALGNSLASSRSALLARRMDRIWIY
jgi:hypothetical protein